MDSSLFPTDPLSRRRAEAQQGGGPRRIAEQHAKGKRTARERIDLLLDPDSFEEIGLFAARRGDPAARDGDGVVIGWGTVDGRKVYVFSQDFTVMGGSIGEVHGRKIAALLRLALQNGAPVIGLNDSGGARIQEGVDSLAGVGEFFYWNVQASGVIPQISVILGPCAGGAVYSPAITDFVFMTEGSAQMFITGPEVVRTVTGQEIDFEELGGAQVHRERSGVAHFTAPDEDRLLAQVRWLLSYLPANNLTSPPAVDARDDPARPTTRLAGLLPADPRHPYDVTQIIAELVDEGEFLEVQPAFAPNLVIGFARMNGKPVGVVANQPMHLAGVLDINASDKGARFIRFCDAFHIPLLTLVDTPGFLPGVDQEHNGIIRHGAKMIYAYAEAGVPRVTLILRKAYGGAYIVMSSKHLGGDLNYALPGAEIAVMGPEAAVNILHRHELAESADPEARRAELAAAYRAEKASPFAAAAGGHLDDILLPEEARRKLVRAFSMLEDKRQPAPPRKHGNIPL